MADSDWSDEDEYEEEDLVHLERMLTEEGGTALHIACLKGSTETVTLLLAEDDVDVNIKTKGGDRDTPIYIACENGHVEVVKLLLAQDGIDVNPTRRWLGDTPLFTAARSGHDEAVKLLLAEEKVNVNHARIANSSTALFVACEYGHAPVVKTLLAKDGIDVNKGDWVQTPLHLACTQWASQESQRGEGPLNPQGEYEQIIKLLVAKDAVDLNCSNRNQGAVDDTDLACTPLHMVAANGSAHMTQLLMVYGADANAVDTAIDWNDGSTRVHRTPADLAAANNFESLADFLTRSASWSQLRIAASCRLHNEVPLMLRQGRMDPDASPLPEILAAITASKAEPAASPWPDAPPICKATIKIVTDATRGWHRTTHWLHHSRVREAVFTVMGVAGRLQKDELLPTAQSQQAEGEHAVIADGARPVLPPEMWMCVMAFFQRSWWTVEHAREIVSPKAEGIKVEDVNPTANTST